MNKLTERKLKRIIREEVEIVEAELSITKLISGAKDLMSFFQPLKNSYNKIISFKKTHPDAWKDLVELLKSVMEELKGMKTGAADATKQDDKQKK